MDHTLERDVEIAGMQFDIAEIQISFYDEAFLVNLMRMRVIDRSGFHPHQYGLPSRGVILTQNAISNALGLSEPAAPGGPESN